MLTRDLCKLLENVQAEVSGLMASPTTLGDRLRWLTLLDQLDELKEDLLRGNGKSWPAGVREVYVRVRTGIKELFELLFNEPEEPPVTYALERLTVYRNRVYNTVAQLTQSGSTIP